MKMKKRTWIFALLICALMLGTVSVSADTTKSYSTGIKYSVYATGVYSNWDGVSTVSQFVNAKGQYCFAYAKGKKVYVVTTKKGKVASTIKLAMKHSLFGAVICDADGNYYVVTGEKNTTDDTTKNTIFVSKYDKNGKHVKTIGDNGSSSLAWYYDSSFYTKIPFDAGCCDVAINGDILTVNYAREMYSEHQSNSVFSVNIKKMKKADTGYIYNSHSFAQRVIPYGDGFVYASEGDCYPRAFSIDYVSTDASVTNYGDIFHFWVKKGTLDDYNMWVLNNNFAHMGGLAAVTDTSVCLVGTSAKSLSSKASSQKEQVFIQIFDPTADLSSASSYVTSGTRSGISGPNGDQEVTDYGVKWLTSSTKYSYKNPQVVSDGNGTIVVLYEQYSASTNKYQGVYYMVLNENGKVVSKAKKYSATTHLNPCEMPEYTNGTIYWTANKEGDSKNTMYVYTLSVSK
jgi:hypothetical protein